MEWRSQERDKVVVPAVGTWSWSRAVRPLSILQQLWTSKGRALGKENFVQPSSTPNKSLGLALTTSPSQRLSTEPGSQCLTCILHSMYSSISRTKLLPYPIELTKVYMPTVIFNKVAYSNSHKEQLFRLDLFYAEVGESSHPKKQCQNLIPFNTCTETQLRYVCKCFPVYYFF